MMAARLCPITSRISDLFSCDEPVVLQRAPQFSSAHDAILGRAVAAAYAARNGEAHERLTAPLLFLVASPRSLHRGKKSREATKKRLTLREREANFIKKRLVRELLRLYITRLKPVLAPDPFAPQAMRSMTHHIALFASLGHSSLPTK